MANNNNIVQIGSALKWRGVYDDSKVYYQENIVTMQGCVFRCRPLKTQGFPPLEEKDGELKYINTDTWDVIVDLTDYYSRFLVQDKINKELQSYIDDLEATLQEQQDIINSFGTIIEATDTISVVSNGVWKNNLPWINTEFWHNPKRYGELAVNTPIDVISEENKAQMDRDGITKEHQLYFVAEED